MRYRQIQAEWRRAQQALQAANLLHQNLLFEDAISRAYYATMHAAKAALLVHDVVAESHAAVRRLFGSSARDGLRDGARMGIDIGAWP